MILMLEYLSLATLRLSSTRVILCRKEDSVENFLVQWPHLEFILSTVWLEAENCDLTLHFGELEADKLLAAE